MTVPQSRDLHTRLSSCAHQQSSRVEGVVLVHAGTVTKQICSTPLHSKSCPHPTTLLAASGSNSYHDDAKAIASTGETGVGHTWDMHAAVVAPVGGPIKTHAQIDPGPSTHMLLLHCQHSRMIHRFVQEPSECGLALPKKLSLYLHTQCANQDFFTLL